jgi:spoIIIJ-associated protein
VSESNGSPLHDQPAERVRDLLERVLDGLGLEEATIEIDEGEREIAATVAGDEDELGLLIGKRGQTIDAVQFLCYQAAFRGMRERKRVTVDAAGYRERRRETLERRADRAAEEATRTGRPAELEEMSSQERRVIHDHLKERAGIETYSEGEEPHRFVVVAPLVGE